MSYSDNEVQKPLDPPSYDDGLFDEEEQRHLISATLQDIHKLLSEQQEEFQNEMANMKNTMIQEMNRKLEDQQQRQRDDIQKLEAEINHVQDAMEGATVESGGAETHHHHQYPHRTNTGGSFYLLTGARRNGTRGEGTGGVLGSLGEDGTKHHYLEEDIFSLMMTNNVFVFEPSTLPLPGFLRAIGERFPCCPQALRGIGIAMLGIGLFRVFIISLYDFYVPNDVIILFVLGIGITWCFMSSPWILGLVTFGVFQIGLGIVIIYDQWINTRNQCEENKGTAEACLPFNIPLRVGGGVIFARYAAVILVLATQTDILSSIQTMLLLKRADGEGWDKVIGEEGSGDNGSRSWSLWIVRILIPNMLKLIQAILILFTSFIIIIQSETIVDLLKDFTAVLIISHADNLMFYVTVQGYFGYHLKQKAMEVKAVRWEIDINNNNDPDSGTNSVVADTICGKLKSYWNLRVCIFGILCITMIGGVSFVVEGQNSGRWFRLRYPQCNAENINAVGDGYCHGRGAYNTEECGFDGGDCELYNSYPNCVVDEPSIIGDGRCHGNEYNTAECGFDGGDCVLFNEKYPDCNITLPYFIGNGRCDNYQPYYTAECGFDGGDCNYY